VPAVGLSGQGGTPDGEGVGLRPAAGEHDLSRLGAEQLRDLGPRAFDRRARSFGVAVAAGWVPELDGEVGQSRLQRRGVDGRGGVVVQVDGSPCQAGMGHSRLPGFVARSGWVSCVAM
jgi:hypothetical protein